MRQKKKENKKKRKKKVQNFHREKCYGIQSHEIIPYCSHNAKYEYQSVKKYCMNSFCIQFLRCMGNMELFYEGTRNNVFYFQKLEPFPLITCFEFLLFWCLTNSHTMLNIYLKIASLADQQIFCYHVLLLKDPV